MMGAMDAKTETTGSAEEARLLAELSERDRKLVTETMAIYPGLPAKEAIEILTEFGGL
jgi:hypothetical protein